MGQIFQSGCLNRIEVSKGQAVSMPPGAFSRRRMMTTFWGGD
jgi:hypothetical protein